MELADCTKEELIWLIKTQHFRYDEKDFEFDILMRRGEALSDAASAELSRATNALKEYGEILASYEGKPVASIPEDVISKATQKMDIRDAAIKKHNRLEQQYSALQKRISEILNLHIKEEPNTDEM